MKKNNIIFLLGKIIFSVAFIVFVISVTPTVYATHESGPICYETEDESDEDTPSYSRYRYNYYKLCEYYENGERVKYTLSIMTIDRYSSKTSVYNYHRVYETDKIYTILNREYNEWLTSGYELRSNYTQYAGQGGKDYFKEVKEWYDTEARRIYTYLEYSGWYSYPSCCSAEWSYVSTNGLSWDALCYPYSNAAQHYFTVNGLPTGNEDGTFYRNDSFNYKAEIELRRNNNVLPCYFSRGYNFNLPTALQLDSCYKYFTHPELREERVVRYGANNSRFVYFYYYPTGNTITTDICIDADIKVRDNATYGNHYISASIDYVYPITRIWNHTNYCSSNPWGNCARPTDESGYQRYYGYNIQLATAMVVHYNPKFLIYPFLNISDLYRWSYDKQLSLAVKYLGSQGNSNDPTDTTIYPNRRALINKNEEEAYAYQIYRGYGIPTVNPDAVKQSLSIPIEYRVRNPSNCNPSDIRVNNNQGYVQDIAVLRESYFVLDVKFTDSSREPSDYVFNFQQYQLADLTLKGYLYTKAGSIAGRDLITDKQVAEYEYIYPARQFLRIVSLRIVTEDNNSQLIPLSIYKIKVESIPSNTREDYDLLSYARMKYNYDIAKLNNNIPDPALVELIICVEDADNTYKPVNIERYNTNFISFLDRFYMLRLPENAKEVFKVNNLLDIPLHYVLQSLTPQYIKITIQTYPYQGEITNVYPLPAYHQYAIYQRDIFLGTGIWTDKYVKRIGSLLHIEAPKHFNIQEVIVNAGGIFTLQNCSIGCIVDVGNNRVVGVAYNEWNAAGLFSYPAVTIPAPSEDKHIGWTMLAIGLLVGFIVLMLLRYFRREIVETKE